MFIARGAGYAMYLSRDAMVMTLKKQDKASKSPPVHRLGKPGKPVTDSVRIELLDANENAVLEGDHQLESRSHYFKGNDPSRYLLNIPNYRAVKCRGIYKGIDLVYYGSQSSIEYDFIVNPGAEPDSIRLNVVGGEPSIDAGGDLVIRTTASSIRWKKPTVYQQISGERKPVEASYIIKSDKSLMFRIGPYDKSHSLVVDPILDYSTYLGGVDDDCGTSVAVMPDGTAYVTGTTASLDFPTTTPVQNGNAGLTDIFVTKISADGTTRLYSTYIGGSDHDLAEGIALNSSGDAFVAGYTYSTDFPVAGTLGNGNAGDADAFVTGISASGSTLIYSTCLGGGRDDYAADIAVDTFGATCVVGYTGSTDFPTSGPYSSVKAAGYDAFLTKINPAGSAYDFSTFIGGDGDDFATGVAVDANLRPYITGYTDSTDYPVLNAFQSSRAGSYDCFVSRFTSAGSALEYSTYLGGAYDDFALGIALHSNQAVLAGHTLSADFPVYDPIQGTPGGNGDVFVAKFAPSGQSLVFSTFLGGSGKDIAYGAATDPDGNVLVTGSTESSNFPTLNPIQLTNNGGADVFLVKYFSTGSALSFSTYIGGSSTDEGQSVDVDTTGRVYVTGQTFSSNFRTAEPLQNTKAGNFDGFLLRMHEDAQLLNFYRDADSDSYGDPMNSVAAPTQPEGYVADSTDCDDTNPLVHPNADEVCNGIDDDCDAEIDEEVKLTFYRDADGDTYGTATDTVEACEPPTGYVATNSDCDDTNPLINPGAEEVLNGIDDDCDNEIDEGLASRTYYRDADGDTYGDPMVSIDATTPPTGYVLDNTDCDDTDPTKSPGAPEILDGLDNNCSGEADENLPGSIIASIGAAIQGSPTAFGGFVYFGADDGKVHAYSLETNEPAPGFPVAVPGTANVRCRPAFYVYGGMPALYVIGDKGAVSKIGLNGTVLWTTPAPGPLYVKGASLPRNNACTPIVDSVDGSVIVGIVDNKHGPYLVKYANDTGAVVLRTPPLGLKTSLISSLATDGNSIFLGLTDGTVGDLLVVNMATLTVRSALAISEDVSGPPLVTDSVVYAGTLAGRFYRLNNATALPDTTFGPGGYITLGEPLTTGPFPVISSTINHVHTTYIGSSAGSVWAVSENGVANLLESHPNPIAGLAGYPEFTGYYALAYGSGSTFYMVDTSDGAMKSLAVAGQITTTPTLDRTEWSAYPHGRFLFGGADGKLYGARVFQRGE